MTTILYSLDLHVMDMWEHGTVDKAVCPRPRLFITSCIRVYIKSFICTIMFGYLTIRRDGNHKSKSMINFCFQHNNYVYYIYIGFNMGHHFEFMEHQGPSNGGRLSRIAPFINIAPNGTGSFCASFGCSNRKSMHK